MAPGAAENTLLQLRNDNCVSWKIIADFFELWFSDVNGIETEGSESPRCRGALEMSMSYCMCEPLETALSLWRPHTCGSNTAELGMRARTSQRFGPACRWVGSLAHRQVLETGIRAKMNVRLRPWCDKQAQTEKKQEREREGCKGRHQKEIRSGTKTDRFCTAQIRHASEKQKYGLTKDVPAEIRSYRGPTRVNQTLIFHIRA